MFIGKYGLDNEIYNNIYYDWKEWHTDTFSPDCENIEILDFKISGYNYKERKECLRKLAIEWQCAFASLCWSYGELAIITEWFSKNAKRYGLLNEFRENGIC